MDNYFIFLKWKNVILKNLFKFNVPNSFFNNVLKLCHWILKHLVYYHYQPSHETKFLGSQTDSQLNWKIHIDHCIIPTLRLMFYDLP